jgi:S1-C subfamily serine protease
MPSVNCPNCRVKLTLPANFSGTGSLKCPKCETVFKPAEQLAAEAVPAATPQAAGDSEAAPAADVGNAFDFGSDDPAPPKPKARPAPAPEPEADDEEEAPARPSRAAKKEKEPPARPRYGKAAAADTGKKKFPIKWVAIGSGAVLVVGVAIAIIVGSGGKPSADKGKEKDKTHTADKGKDKRDTRESRTNTQQAAAALPEGVKELFQAGTTTAPAALPPPVPLLQRTGRAVLTIPAFAEEKAPPPDPAAGKLSREEVRRATTLVKVAGDEGAGTGSGFVIRADGPTCLVATNHHVVAMKQATIPKVTVHVVFDSGSRKEEQEVKAAIVAVDAVNDLAILRVEGVKNPPKPLDPRVAPAPTETQDVYAFGFPLGSLVTRVQPGMEDRNPEITIVQGKVSALRKGGDDDHLSIVQMDITLNPGNSGGPVVDTDGRLVGVAVAKLNSAVAERVGFAVAIPELLALLAGRIQEPTFSPGKKDGADAEFTVTVPVSDPFGQLKGAALYYKVGDAAGGTEKEPLMPGATKVDLPAGGAKDATVPLKLPFAEGTTVHFQLAATHSSGRTTVSRSVPYKLAMGRPAAAAGGAMITMEQLDADPEKYQGDKEVVVRGRVAAQAAPYKPGVFELDLMLDGPRPEKAINLMGLVGPELADQVKDMPEATSSVVYYLKLTTRVTIRVGRKGSAPDGRTPVRVIRLEYVTRDGRALITVPSDEVATKFPLIGMNREPDKYAGKSHTFEAFVTGLHDGGKDFEVDVATVFFRTPENLTFLTTRELAAKIRAAGKGEDGASTVLVTLTAEVEKGKAANGRRVVRITGVEPGTGKSFQ